MTALTRPAGPNGPFFGLLTLAQFQRDTLGFLARTAQEYGDLAHFRMARFHFYLVNNPEYVREAMVAQGGKLTKWEFQNRTWINAVGRSTLTSEGDFWKRHRALIQPAFHPKRVGNYEGLIRQHTARLLESWSGGGEREIMFEMMRTTMGIIADILFTLRDMQAEANDLNWALTTVFEQLTLETAAVFSTPNWIPTPRNLREKRATGIIRDFIMAQIRQHRAAESDQGDMLSAMLRAVDPETGSTLTDDEICNELKTLFGAGHETTALMLTWTLYLLAQHPEIEQRLYEEAINVLGADDPTAANIEQMPYTEMVIRESMRLYPPTWSLMVRQVNEPITLGGTTIPTGSLLLVPQWVVHRDPRTFPDPLRFDPERFAGDWRGRYPSHAYFPFGAGAHICLGAHLSMLEGRLMLPMLVRRFRYHRVDATPVKTRALITTRPVEGIRLRMEERSR
jgi:cytochrome P450